MLRLRARLPAECHQDCGDVAWLYGASCTWTWTPSSSRWSRWTTRSSGASLSSWEAAPTRAAWWPPPPTRRAPSACIPPCRCAPPPASARSASSSRATSAICRDLAQIHGHTGRFHALPGADGAGRGLYGRHRLRVAPRQLCARWPLAIKKRVRDELGINVSVGIANSKVVAKIASDASKPDGLIEVPPGGEAAFLAPLPIRQHARHRREDGARAERAGHRHHRQAGCARPRRSSKSCWGATASTCATWRWGWTTARCCLRGEAKSMSRETTFAEDLRDRSLLEATLRYLAERVGRRLRQSGKLARCVTIKLRYADFATITRNRTLPQATDADEVIFGAGLNSTSSKTSSRHVSTAQPLHLLRAPTTIQRQNTNRLGPQLEVKHSVKQSKPKNSLSTHK